MASRRVLLRPVWLIILISMIVLTVSASSYIICNQNLKISDADDTNEIEFTKADVLPKDEVDSHLSPKLLSSKQISPPVVQKQSTETGEAVKDILKSGTMVSGNIQSSNRIESDLKEDVKPEEGGSDMKNVDESKPQMKTPAHDLDAHDLDDNDGVFDTFVGDEDAFEDKPEDRTRHKSGDPLIPAENTTEAQEKDLKKDDKVGSLKEDALMILEENKVFKGEGQKAELNPAEKEGRHVEMRKEKDDDVEDVRVVELFEEVPPKQLKSAAIATEETGVVEKDEDAMSLSQDGEEVLEILDTEREGMKEPSAGIVLAYLVKKHKSLKELKGLLEVYPDFYSRPVVEGKYLIHLAAKSEWPEFLNYLVNLVRVDVNQKTEDGLGDTALHYAARCGNSDENARILVRAGAEVDAVNSEGETALFAAVLSDNYEMAKYLLTEAGADPNKLIVDPISGSAKTILNTAVAARGRVFIDLLLENGADPLLTDSTGRNAIQMARAGELESTATFIEAFVKTSNRNFKDFNSISTSAARYTEDDMTITEEALKNKIFSNTYDPLSRLEVD